MNIEAIREDFPILQKTVNGNQLIYLDSAATSQKPVQVIDEIERVLREDYSNPGRSIHTLGHRATEAIQEARETVASFAGAARDEIVFTQNSTDSLNQIARFLCDRTLKDKNIVIPETEHHSNYLPWKQAAERTGAAFKTVPVDDGRITPTAVEETVDSDTHVFAWKHVCNVTGNIYDPDTILDAASEATHTVLDACQSIPSMPVDLKALDVDFAAFSAHKMLGPSGVGVLYGREELLDRVQPARFGGGMVREATRSSYKNTPGRHEAGTVNLEGILGTARAAEYLETVGKEHIERHTRALAKTLVSRLEDTALRPLTDSPESGIVSLTHETIHSHDLSSMLNQEGIAVRAGHHCTQPLLKAIDVSDTLRISPYLYNTAEEIEKTADVLRDAVEQLDVQ